MDKRCVRRYMASKIWRGFWEPVTLTIITMVTAAPIICVIVLLDWLFEVYPYMVGFLLSVWFGVFIMACIQRAKNDIVKLYNEARRECGYQ